ncbi:MAG: exonuclease SbcCD subunit D, partial [Anaerolineae bacterium]|nr:exonuclease SbcCD subunit D [Anaerolineae bacterium]
IPAVLTAHLSVSEATYGSEHSVMLGRDTVILQSALTDRAWDYVALGHIHKHQSLNEGAHPHIVYAGSPARIDFGEEGQPKGFCWVEVARGDTTWEFVPVHARPFVTVRVDLREELSPLMTLQQKIAKHDLSEAVVRLIIEMRAEQEPLLNERDIREMLSDAYYVGSISRDVERQTRLRLSTVAPEKMTDADLLEHYLRDKGLDDAEQLESLRQRAADIFAADDDR